MTMNRNDHPFHRCINIYFSNLFIYSKQIAPSKFRMSLCFFYLRYVLFFISKTFKVNLKCEYYSSMNTMYKVQEKYVNNSSKEKVNRLSSSTSLAALFSMVCLLLFFLRLIETITAYQR